jgi:tetratricopeptide (TPR) repeat protein
MNESCPISRHIGSEKICLPILSGMNECIMEANVMDYLNSRTMQGNSNIALYIDDINKHAINNLENEILENYLIVYTTKDLENDKINENFISLLDSVITSNYRNFINENWNIIKDRMKEKVENLDLDQPVLIDHYYIAKNVPCIITLGRAYENNVDRIFLTATVIQELNGKFLAYAWYLNYEGENSLINLKSKVDYFSLLISQMNKTKIKQEPAKIDVEPKLMEAVTYFNTAYKKSSEGKYKDAIDLYSKAIELYPKNERIKISEAYFNRGINKRYLNDLSGAISDYSKAIEIRPEFYKAYHNRGVAKMKKQDFDGAIEDFTIIIKSESLDKNIIASSYGNRGFAKFSIGQNACPDFRKAFELGSEDYKAYLQNCK